jgi:biopolymer transport protein ExbD
MRLSSRKRNETKIELPMSSMIDVVFLLLIFFLVTSSFTKTERHLDPAVKMQESSAASAAEDLEPAIVEVVWGDDATVYRLGAREFVDVNELTDVLLSFDDKSRGAFVRVADDVPFGAAAAAIQACKDGRFTKVSYVPLSAN